MACKTPAFISHHHGLSGLPLMQRLYIGTKPPRDLPSNVILTWSLRHQLSRRLIYGPPTPKNIFLACMRAPATLKGQGWNKTQRVMATTC